MNKNIKFDLHVHSMLSKSIPFSIRDLHLMINQAKTRELDGFALTEHIHAPDYWKTYRLIRKHFHYKKGVYYVQPDFYIFNGAEINLSSDGHVVVIGDMEAIHEMDRKLGLSRGYRPDLSELLEYAPSELMLHGAHPFRPNGGIIKSDKSLIIRLSALELNGRDFAMESQVRRTAEELCMPLIGGSDAHFWPQLGISVTILPRHEINIDNLKNSVQSDLTEARLLEESAFVVDMCSRYKSWVKSFNNDNEPEYIKDIKIPVRSTIQTSPAW